MMAVMGLPCHQNTGSRRCSATTSGDCYELLTDVRVLNTLANLFGGQWTVWVCAGCGHVEAFRR